MGVNKASRLIIKEWARKLSWKQQAAKIPSFNHLDKAEAEFWRSFYYNMVQAFYTYPGTQDQTDFCLYDGVDTCCHKT